MGYNSENFDFDFLLGRANILGLDIDEIETTLNKNIPIKRIGNSSVKFGNSAEKYTATQIWGMSVIDILHAVKRTVAVNTDIKNNKLKYICKFEDIAKPDRMYINGEDGGIGKMWKDNKIHMINRKNNQYVEIPEKYQTMCSDLYKIQNNVDNITKEEYIKLKKQIIQSDITFVNWFKKECVNEGMSEFIYGVDILKRYLLDDLWETEQVDNRYNQSSFLLAKLVPTTFTRVSTMGNAAVWNLLMTAWSYENDLAIPESDEQIKFPGGLTRCFKKGYYKRVVKIDYASLYPMLQLTHDIFPMFDITGVIKMMLTYMTTTRNIYKKLASGDDLNSDEVELMKEIDHESYIKYINGNITDEDRTMFKVKQLPIKILNNSLFGALGSGIAFNWSDNVCAARITCTGRLELRHAISWFKDFGCEPLLAVTDGVNFGIPDTTKIRVNENGIFIEENEGLIEEMWQYKNKEGIAALIEKFNDDEMIRPYMSVDNDGEFISTLNLSRINYALLYEKKNKKTGEIERKVKLTGNTIKSKTMPEYIEEFIDKGLTMILEGQGSNFVDYYNEYAKKIYYKQIPLKKIATKKRIRNTIAQYNNRGTDKNGRLKAKQAHMELLIEDREKNIKRIFNERFDELFQMDQIKKFTLDEMYNLVEYHMPPEAELDSVVHYVNVGEKKSDGDSAMIIDSITGEERFCSLLINQKDMEENPNLCGEYNVEKYLAAFNTRVMVLLEGYDEDLRSKILISIKKTKKKDEFGNKKPFVH